MEVHWSTSFNRPPYMSQAVIDEHDTKKTTNIRSHSDQWDWIPFNSWFKHHTSTLGMTALQTLTHSDRYVQTQQTKVKRFLAQARVFDFTHVRYKYRLLIFRPRPATAHIFPLIICTQIWTHPDSISGRYHARESSSVQEYRPLEYTARTFLAPQCQTHCKLGRTWDKTPATNACTLQAQVPNPIN